LVAVTENLDLPSLHDAVQAFIRELHSAIHHKDIPRIGDLIVPDVFILGPGEDAVSVGRDPFLINLQSLFAQLKEEKLNLHTPDLRIGGCSPGSSTWFLDRFEIEVPGGQGFPHNLPIRLTGLLVRDSDWRLEAAFWSIPLRDNDYQYDLMVAGKIPPGIALEDQVAPEARSLAQSIIKVMAQPISMPDLYSTRPDAFTIGSTADEVFVGADGKNFVKEITQLPLKFAIRGGIRGAVSPDGCTAWMVTQVDLTGGITMPYRFFYIWLHEQGGWKIVVSHDAVSIDPSNPGFEVP
jgi:ketosteroid isomerase-like protein